MPSTLRPWLSGHTVLTALFSLSLLAIPGSDARSSGADGTWTLQVQGAPTARREFTTMLDLARNRMLVFGGQSNSSNRTYTELWALPLDNSWTWTQLAIADSQSPPNGMSDAIYDPIRDRIVAFGYNSAVWTLPLSGALAWQQIFPAGTPPSQRDGQRVIYDPIRDRAVMFGGAGPDGIDYGQDGPPLFNDVWTLSLGDHPTWTQLFPSGGPPMGRGAHALVYDPVRDRMIVYGGLLGGYNNYLEDTWALSLGQNPAWVPLTDPNSPASAPTVGGLGRGLYYVSAAYDPFRDRLLVFGGAGQEVTTNDVWALPLSGTAIWTRMVPDGVLPFFEFDADGAIFDSQHDRMVVYGSTAIGPGYTWTLQFADQATPTLLSLVGADADAQSVKLKWYSASGSVTASVYRRTQETSWRSIGSVTSDGTGFLKYEDDAVTPGTRYGYRLGMLEGGSEVFAGEVWEVAAQPQFALLGARPNPAVGGRLSVAFVLPTNEAAKLELFDVTGRQVAMRDVGSLGPGQHVVDLADASHLPAGSYLIRLHHAQRTLIAKAVVMR